MPVGKPRPSDAPPPAPMTSQSRPDGVQRAGSGPSWGWAAAWGVAGAAALVGLAGILTIGIVLLPVALLLIALLATLPRARSSAFGAVYGASLPFLVIGVVNLGGPIECPGFGTVYPGEIGGRCAEKWNPLPWLAFGLAIAGIGVAVQIGLQRRARHHSVLVED